MIGVEYLLAWVIKISGWKYVAYAVTIAKNLFIY